MMDVFIAYCQPDPDNVEIIGVFATMQDAQANVLTWGLEEKQVGSWRSLVFGSEWKKSPWSIAQGASEWECGDFAIVQMTVGQRAPVDKTR